jgi:hypothetical protein
MTATAVTRMPSRLTCSTHASAPSRQQQLVEAATLLGWDRSTPPAPPPSTSSRGGDIDTEHAIYAANGPSWTTVVRAAGLLRARMRCQGAVRA